jgi:hypothetical protein
VIEALAPLVDLFRLHTRLFHNTLVGLDETAAATRPNGRTNSIAFVAGHLVETRAWMGRYLGVDTPAPFGGALEHATGIEQITEMPTLLKIGPAWTSVSERVAVRLESLAEAELAAPSSQRFPGVAPTVLGGIAFLVHHESYHLGQLGLLRKFAGRDPMSYR